MEFIAWLVVMLIVSFFGEILAEVTKVLNSDENLKPVAVVWFVFLGLVCGVITVTAAPGRVLPSGPFQGVSVLVLPVLFGAGLAFVGWARGVSRSNFASWYGGAAIGVDLAVGRLIGLAFVAEVRSV
ncbi:MAG TPA: hypothetical protein VLK65_20090 [Vicinamibacteria bacterium]|nr:hypothetical protein [Vicinamibacteria bacterium]